MNRRHPLSRPISLFGWAIPLVPEHRNSDAPSAAAMILCKVYKSYLLRRDWMPRLRGHIQPVESLSDLSCGVVATRRKTYVCLVLSKGRRQRQCLPPYRQRQAHHAATCFLPSFASMSSSSNGTARPSQDSVVQSSSEAGPGPRCVVWKSHQSLHVVLNPING